MTDPIRAVLQRLVDAFRVPRRSLPIQEADRKRQDAESRQPTVEMRPVFGWMAVADGRVTGIHCDRNGAPGALIWTPEAGLLLALAHKTMNDPRSQWAPAQEDKDNG